LSPDHGEDIESHLDDLFAEKQSPAPAPTASLEPSTGRDNDADAAVADELDLENELNAKLGVDENASVPQVATPTTTPRRTEVPLASGATTTVSKPVSGDGPTAGRFQTEAFTRKRTMPQPFPVAADTIQPAGLARWSWVAIPVTVGVVFLAAFFMTRSQETQPDADVAATSLSLPADPIDEADPPTAVTEPGESISTEPAIETPPEVAVQEPAPTDPAPRIAAQIPVSPKPAPRNLIPDPVTPAPIETRKPDPVVEREPLEPQIQDVEPIPEPVVESTPSDPEPEPEPEPEPAPPVEPIREPSTPDSTTHDPVSQDAVQDPITRDPILIQRVEPQVSKKDLKKGGGTIVLRVRISESGTVTRVLVDQGLSGSPLEAAAVAAVLRWRYEPALDRDEPVEAWTIAQFTFD
jgi:TonB family protein